MCAKWIGSIISVDCGDVLGVFEGEISNVDEGNQTISLINVSRNSVKCQVPEVTLSTHDIKKLKLIESTVKNYQKEKLATSLNVSTPSSKNDRITNSPLVEDDSKRKASEGKKKNTKRIENKKWQKERDEACFSAPVDSEVLDSDFDFEKNLALFDKRAVFDEINALSKGDHIRLVDCNKRTGKYRHDENVLTGDIPILRQISVPCKHTMEYVTDTGLVVPSVTLEYKKLLYDKSEEAGLGPNVRVEMIGRGACEMVIHLLGGGHRLNPQNTHQRPSVVILCGSHTQGAQGINCGRQLANHCAITTVLIPNLAKESHSILSNELKLFGMTHGKAVHSISALPTTVDFIVDALESHEEIKQQDKIWVSNARKWANQTKARILCLDPPPNCTSTEHSFILSPALPFSFKTNKCSIHICDIGFPKTVFSSIGCKYSSPFGSKFVIPLYPNIETT
ncbi:enhancer of mRNA-decapping protein 3 [Caerostris extrusa]|uniref:Enhancer of mRNA-decapping protein 3 n=1 Tax=Caerostris extrusa TaxID=172846 RepID=A0AAV4RWD0_CAEEX|nr:enhancer of mRNA-decapping protein 3 [Caerostris extrusa]